MGGWDGRRSSAAVVGHHSPTHTRNATSRAPHYDPVAFIIKPQPNRTSPPTSIHVQIKRRRAREVQGEYVGRKPEMQAHLEK